MTNQDETLQLMELLHERQCTYERCPWNDEKIKITEGVGNNKKLDEIYLAPHHNYFRVKATRLLQHLDFETLSKSLKLIYTEAYKIPEA